MLKYKSQIYFFSFIYYYHDNIMNKKNKQGHKYNFISTKYKNKIFYYCDIECMQQNIIKIHK